MPSPSKTDCTLQGIPLGELSIIRADVYVYDLYEIRQAIFHEVLVTQATLPSRPPANFRKIYYEHVVTVTPAGQSGPGFLTKHFNGPTSSSSQDANQITALFFVSKQISKEARDVFYGSNTFTTLFRPNRRIDDVMETVAAGDGTEENVWHHHRNELRDAVRTIYNADSLDIPDWFIGDFAPEYESGEEELSMFMPIGQNLYLPTGIYLPTFLRKIGAQNAAMITTVEIKLLSFKISTDALPLYVVTLCEYVKGLRKIIIDFKDFNAYKTKIDLVARNKLQEKLVLRFFGWLRVLFHNCPKLDKMEMRNCADEIKTMGELVVVEKVAGVSVDFKARWRTLFEAAKQRAIADPRSVDWDSVYQPNWPVAPTRYLG
ncbi:MAG: hypothetical protein Q9208_001620 [Pyrenodesmia sp. 3 TL-2023]